MNSDLEYYTTPYVAIYGILRRQALKVFTYFIDSSAQRILINAILIKKDIERY